MKVTLIDYTGAGSPDPLYAARLLVYTKNTRLEQGEGTRAKVQAMTEAELTKELDYIANTLRSSWEFCDYTFEIIGVTRAFTHQLVRTRTGTYAQQAQRVVDMSAFDFVTPEPFKKDVETEVEYRRCMKAIAETYHQFRLRGYAAQDCRAVLPTNVCTNIIAKFNLRTLADLIGKRDNARAQGEYVDVVRGMVGEMTRVHPWVHPFLYPERLATPVIDQLLKEALGDASPIDQPRINSALKELDKVKATWG